MIIIMATTFKRGKDNIQSGKASIAAFADGRSAAEQQLES